MATGASDIPNLPDIPGLAHFKGRTLHSSEYGDAAHWNGRPVMLIGSGTSGDDIAQDLVSNGAQVTLVQPDPDRQSRTQCATALHLVQRGARALGVRPDRRVDAAGADGKSPSHDGRAGA